MLHQGLSICDIVPQLDPELLVLLSHEALCQQVNVVLAVRSF